jgi:hypothetical protein
MVAIGLAIEATRDGDVAWIASAPIVLLLALTLARGAKPRSGGSEVKAPK